MTHDVDIVIVGSGFSGSILAMIARRLGRSVMLLERERHPRFAIGESSTPLAGLLLEDIARRYDLPRLLPLSKYGAWKRTYPDVACGLKRGFSFFRHDAGVPFVSDQARNDQLLVAASPHDLIGDVHWYRADVDHFLVLEAIALGVDYRDSVDVVDLATHAGGVQLTLSHRSDDDGSESAGGQTTAADRSVVRTRLVVDATGPRGFLHGRGLLGDRELPGLVPTQSLFTHFTGVRRFAEVAPMAFSGTPPYAVDDAAVHHVFDGGWIWVLRFDNGVISAGVAASDALAQELRLHEGAPAWQRLMRRFPSIGEQFERATPTREFSWWPRLSFLAESVAGDGWVALPSAAGIVDPLLSTGFPLTLLGVQRIAAAISESWDSPHEFTTRLQDYASRTTSEIETTSELVGALYEAFGDWELFSSLSFLYFAAVGFAESRVRLGASSVTDDSFLLTGHETFAPALEQCLALAAQLRVDTSVVGRRALRKALLDAIAIAIEPVNVSGLADAARRNWYPAEATSIVAAADKLGSSTVDVKAMLARCGFTDQAFGD